MPAPGASGIPVIVRRILAFGATVRLELEREAVEDGASVGATLEAEISRDRLRELGLAEGDHVLLQPRGARVFPAPAAAAAVEESVKEAA